MSKKKRRGDDAGIDMQASKEELSMREDGDEPASSGTFKRADDSVLKQRVIRKAKRRVGASSSASSNPFASVNLLNPNPNPNGGTSTTSLGTSKAINASASKASALGTASESSGGLFGSAMSKMPGSTLASSKSSSSTSSSGLFGSMGGGLSSGSKTFVNPFAAAAGPSSSASAAASSKSIFGMPVAGSSSKPSLFSAPTGSGGSSGGKEEYLRDVAALNRSFRAWIEKQDIDKSWAEGVADYIAFAEKLQADKEGLDSSSAKANGTNSSLPPASSSVPAASGFTSGLFSNGSIFSSNPSSGLSMASNPNANETASEEKEEEKEEAIKVEAKLADDEELLHEVRSKVMWFRKEEGGGSWGAKGTGQLQLLKQKTGSLRWLLMRTETTGRVTFNAPLFKGMKVDVDEKGKAVTFVGVSYKESKSGQLEKENDGNPTLFRLKVKQVADANALAEAIRKAAPQ